MKFFRHLIFIRTKFSIPIDRFRFECYRNHEIFEIRGKFTYCWSHYYFCLITRDFVRHYFDMRFCIFCVTRAPTLIMIVSTDGKTQQNKNYRWDLTCIATYIRNRISLHKLYLHDWWALTLKYKHNIEIQTCYLNTSKNKRCFSLIIFIKLLMSAAINYILSIKYYWEQYYNTRRMPIYGIIISFSRFIISN